MRTYKYKKTIEENFNGNLNIEILNENFITDLIKITKKKYFDESYYVTTKNANNIKIVFAESFIRSLQSLKFRKFSFSKFYFKTEDVISKIQEELLGILKSEKEKERTNPIFNLIYGKREYKPNTSLSNECYKIVVNIENWILKNLNTIITELYNINPAQENDKTMKKFLGSFTKLFVEIFEKTEKKFKFSLTLDSFSRKSKFEELAFRVIKEIKRETKDKNLIDIEKTFVMDDDIEKNVDKTKVKKELKEEEIQEELSKIPYPYMMSTINQFITVNKLTIEISKWSEFEKIFKEAYKEILIDLKGKRRPEKDEIIDMMGLLSGISSNKEKDKK
jgi:hypothetical protein